MTKDKMYIEKTLMVEVLKQLLKDGMKKSELLEALAPVICENTLIKYITKGGLPSDNKYCILKEKIEQQIQDEYNAARERFFDANGFKSIKDYKVYLYKQLLEEEEEEENE